MRSRSNASDQVRREWLRRVEAEYTSAALTQHFTLWLMQIAASPDLVMAGLRIAKDEMEHARLAFEVYGAAGGERAPAIDRERLALPRSTDPLEHDVVRFAVRIFCVGETVAVPLFKALRERCTVAPARKALDRVLRDEVRHRDFGWTALGWLLEERSELRAVAAAALPDALANARLAYGAKARDRTLDDADRAWGLMPRAEYVAVVSRTLARDWIPRFRKMGIDAEAAWDEATARMA